MNNPFKGPRYDDMQTYHVTADDRIRAVKAFSREQCLAALAVPGLQKTVERVVQARLRQLAAGE